jgi:hypothetical protein
LELARDALLTFEPMTTALVPELHLRAAQPDRWLQPLTLPRNVAKAFAGRHDVSYGVVEIDDQPYAKPADWIRIRPETLRQVAAYVAAADLDIPFQPSSVSYYVRRDESAMHRRQHPTAPENTRAVANDLCYALTGFNLRNIRDMGAAIAYIEFLATTTHIQQCCKRFADQLTPALLKAHEAEPRALVRALRMTFNAALVAVGRDRQARALDDTPMR